jgi:hypothetical protein
MEVEVHRRQFSSTLLSSVAYTCSIARHEAGASSMNTRAISPSVMGGTTVAPLGTIACPVPIWRKETEDVGGKKTER